MMPLDPMTALGCGLAGLLVLTRREWQRVRRQEHADEALAALSVATRREGAQYCSTCNQPADVLLGVTLYDGMVYACEPCAALLRGEV